MKIYAPTGSTSASARGIQLTVAADGSVDVTPDIAEELISCGFTMDAPAAPLSDKQQAAADKAAADAQAALDAAIQESLDAQKALGDVEGRGNENAVAKAKAVLAAAEAKVVSLRGAL